MNRPAPGMLSVNWQRPPKAGGRKAQDCGRERACNLAPKAQPVAPGEERVIHSPRPPDGGKKRFWCLLGLRPKGTAARRRKHFVLSSGVLRDAQNIPSRDSAATVPLLKQHPCVSCGKLLRRMLAQKFVCRLVGSALLPDAPILRGEKPICAQPASAPRCFGAFAQISGGEKVKNL